MNPSPLLRSQRRIATSLTLLSLVRLDLPLLIRGSLIGGIWLSLTLLGRSLILLGLTLLLVCNYPAGADLAWSDPTDLVWFDLTDLAHVLASGRALPLNVLIALSFTRFCVALLALPLAALIALTLLALPLAALIALALLALPLAALIALALLALTLRARLPLVLLAFFLLLRRLFSLFAPFAPL